MIAQTKYSLLVAESYRGIGKRVKCGACEGHARKENVTCDREFCMRGYVLYPLNEMMERATETPTETLDAHYTGLERLEDVS